MPIQLKGSQIVTMGGEIATEHSCCCQPPGCVCGFCRMSVSGVFSGDIELDPAFPPGENVCPWPDTGGHTSIIISTTKSSDSGCLFCGVVYTNPIEEQGLCEFCPCPGCDPIISCFGYVEGFVFCYTDDAGAQHWGLAIFIGIVFNCGGYSGGFETHTTVYDEPLVPPSGTFTHTFSFGALDDDGNGATYEVVATVIVTGICFCIRGGPASATLFSMCGGDYSVRMSGTGGVVLCMTTLGYGTFTQHICGPDCNASECLNLNTPGPAITTPCCADWTVTITDEGSGYYGVAVSLSCGGCGGCCSVTGSWSRSGLHGDYSSGVIIPGSISPSGGIGDNEDLFLEIMQSNNVLCASTTPPECCENHCDSDL